MGEGEKGFRGEALLGLAAAGYYNSAVTPSIFRLASLHLMGQSSSRNVGSVTPRLYNMYRLRSLTCTACVASPVRAASWAA